MQVRVVPGGDMAFDAMIYPPTDMGMVDYINRHMNNVIEGVQGLSTQFVDTAKAMYDRFNGTAAINAAKSVLYSLGGHVNQDVIFPVNDISKSNMIMQRYIMDLPEVNKLYKNNMCNGFQDTYLNPEPGTYGSDRYGYRNIMDGMMQYDDKGEGYYMTYSHNDITSPVDEIMFIDKLAVMDTWEHVKNLIADGIDPTSMDGEDL